MADTNRVINATLAKYVKSLEPEWVESLPLMMKTMERGNVRYGAGGLDIRWQIEKTQNPNFETFNNFQALTVAATDTTTQATLEYGQYRSNDFLPKREILQNKDSEARIYALEESKVRFLMDSAKDDLGADFHNGAGGKEIVGFETAIPDTNFTAKSYGGINFTGNTFWQPTQVAGNSFTNSSFTTDCLIAIQQAKLGASHGRSNEAPDTMIGTQDTFQRVGRKHDANERYKAETNRRLGGTGLMVHDMELLWDRDAESGILRGYNFSKVEVLFMTDSIFSFERREEISPSGILYYLESWPCLRVKSPRFFFAIDSTTT